MPTPLQFGLTSVADQRYYHFVVLRESKLSLQGYWRRFEDVRNPDSNVNVRDARVVLQHRKLRSSTSYARGAVAAMLSEKGEGRAPYYYDLIAMQADVAGTSLLLVGFPFASLALDTFKNILNGAARGAGRFVAVDVAALVGVMEAGFKRRYEALNTHVVGVQFSVTDDKYLTNVRLGGDDPLAAEIYTDFLRERLVRRFVLPDRCALACERQWAEQNMGQPHGLLRSRVHFDNNGNFKVYAQAGCANLIVLAYALGQLQSAGLLKDASGNPLVRLQQDSEE